MKPLLMLDSGAFSAWKRSLAIHLEDYIAFCKEFKDASYFVNLDVIPGKFGGKRDLRTPLIEESCKQGWANYLEMLQHLPKSKVIPVYHQNDHVDWLHKMLDFGCPYVGISPANDCDTGSRLRWMKGLRPYLFDEAGRPLVKTHGFAVTAWDTMQYWDWHSVDSCTYELIASFGGILLPRKTRRVLDYSKPPFIVAVSPISPTMSFQGKHFSTLSPSVISHVEEYLESCGSKLGSYERVSVAHDHKMGKGEIWLSKGKEIFRTLEDGVSMSRSERVRVNARFMRLAEKELPVKHIYMAGTPQDYKFTFGLEKRLVSYGLVLGSKSARKPIQTQINKILAYRERKACGS